MSNAQISRQRIVRQNEAEAAVPVSWEFDLVPDAHAVASARHAVIEAARAAGASEDDAFSLDLALGEALANAVTHGTPPAEGRAHMPIHLRLWRFHGHLIVEISDAGPGFEPPAPPYAMPEDAGMTHGRGLPLMQRLTDALLVSRGDVRTGGLSVYLVKELSLL